MKNKPQQLKERIYALNPELKKLGFGCEIVRKEYKLKIEGEAELLHTKSYIVIDTNYEFNGEKVDIDGVVVVDKDQMFGKSYPDFEKRFFAPLDISDDLKAGLKFEIIGKPIQLQHLLLAIKDVAIIKLYSDGLEIVANHLAVMYDLTKSFDQNIAENEELVTFLLSIIKE